MYESPILLQYPQADTVKRKGDVSNDKVRT